MTPTPTRKVDVAIVGGGLAGLRAAQILQKAGREWLLFESSEHLGGRVATEVVEGYRCDLGFQVYLDSYEEGRNCLDLEALDLRRFLPGARIWHSKKWVTVADPIRLPWQVLPTLLSGVGTWSDQLRVLALRWRSRLSKSEDSLDPSESTLAYLRRFGFSDLMVDRFFRPFYGGILLDRDLRAPASFFRESFRLFSEGFACVPALGMVRIPQHMASPLPDDRILRGRSIRSLCLNETMWSIDAGRDDLVEARCVILATDRPSAARLLAPMSPWSHAILEKHPQDVGTRCVWLETPFPVLASKMIHLNSDPSHGPIHNLAELSSVAPEYLGQNSSNRGLLAATVLDSEARHYDSDSAINQAVVDQLQRWFPTRTGDVRVLRHQSIPFAQPGQAGLSRPNNTEGPSGLFLAGDYLQTASINGALKSGRLAAQAAEHYLNS